MVAKCLPNNLEFGRVKLKCGSIFRTPVRRHVPKLHMRGISRNFSYAHQPKLLPRDSHLETSHFSDLLPEPANPVIIVRMSSGLMDTAPGGETPQYYPHT